MAHSLSAACTPLKHEYDACFNTWFEGYLEPAVNSSSPPTAEHRAAYSKQKAEEFEQKCGKVWREYKSCVQRAVTEKGLDELLRQARDENPLRDPPPPHSPPASTS